jgi:DNA-directed RNA polymerase subunit M/transcription elongation factor TFIIS
MIDLTNLGNEQDNEIYLCEFCNIMMIQKLDDIKYLGWKHNRWICSSCGYIVDTAKEGDVENAKHKEQLHTLTDSSDYKPHAEILSNIGEDSEVDDDELDPDPERNFDITTFDKHEMEDYVAHGIIKGESITRSSVTGRIERREWGTNWH